VHREELERLAKEAEVARGREEPREEILARHRALELLPPDSDQSRSITARVSELSRVVEERVEKPKSRWRWAGWYWTGEGLLVLLLIVAGFRAFGAEAGSSGDRVAFVQFVVLLAALSALTFIEVAV
jgi:hypothetical protein